MNKDYIIFDGSCGFCNKTLMFIAKNDTYNKFIFVSSLSDFGLSLLSKHKICGVEKLTIILLENEHILSFKSRAIKKILSKTSKYKVISSFVFLLPVILTDKIYDLISINRQKIIISKTCVLPSLEIKRKFIL